MAAGTDPILGVNEVEWVIGDEHQPTVMTKNIRTEKNGGKQNKTKRSKNNYLHSTVSRVLTYKR